VFEVEPDRYEYELEFELSRGVTVRGLLIAEDETPVAGAEVWIGSQQGAFDAPTAVSDDDGRFALECVQPGQHQAGATRDGFAPAQTSFEVPEHGLPEDLVLQFPSARVVRGLVLDVNGQPLSGISIAAQQNFDYVGGQSRTDAAGEFELRDLPQGRIQIEAFARGFVRIQVPVASTEDHAEITVDSAGRLSGRAIDARTGEALTTFTVRFVHTSDRNLTPRVDGFNANWSQPG
jgi:hypothetical protein